MGKEKKKKISKSNKNVENMHSNLSSYILIQNVKKIGLILYIFFQLSTCDAVQKSICMVLFL